MMELPQAHTDPLVEAELVGKEGRHTSFSLLGGRESVDGKSTNYLPSGSDDGRHHQRTIELGGGAADKIW